MGFLPFADKPLARLKMYIGRASGESPAFLFFHTGKQRNFFQIARGNHVLRIMAFGVSLFAPAIKIPLRPRINIRPNPRYATDSQTAYSPPDTPTEYSQ